jgi:hypothetical protein
MAELKRQTEDCHQLLIEPLEKTGAEAGAADYRRKE